MEQDSQNTSEAELYPGLEGSEIKAEVYPPTDLQQFLQILQEGHRKESDKKWHNRVGYFYALEGTHHRHRMELYGIDHMGNMHIFGIPEKSAQENGSGYCGVYYYGSKSLEGKSVTDFHFGPNDSQLPLTSGLEVARVQPKK